MKPNNRRDVAMAFAKVLRAARDNKGLTQEELAERADLDPTYPSLLERAKRTPTLWALINIAIALDVTPAQIVSDTLERLT